MAIKNLYFRVYEGVANEGVRRIVYDDEQKKVLDSQDGRTVANSDAPTNDLPGFLDPDDKLENVVPNGQDVYMHVEGELIYRVRKQTNFPNAYVTSEFFYPLEAEVYEVNDTSQFGVSDGSYKYELKKGSGYVYDARTTYRPNAPAIKLPGLDPGEFRGDQFLSRGDYSQTARDALTLNEITIEATISEPPCTLLIESIDTTPESAPGGEDGTITVNATSDNDIEYNLNRVGGPNGAWQDSNVFSGLVDDEYTVYARDKNQPLCIQSKPASVAELPCDLVIDQIKILHESFLDQADARITVLATSEREVEYSLSGSPFQDTNIFPDLAAGEYQVSARLKAANTCLVQQTVTVNEGATFQSTIQHVECGDSPTGKITVSPLVIRGYHSPLTFQWDNGTQGAVIEKLKPGDYTLQISVADGRTKEFTYTVDGQPPIVITATVDQGTVNLSVSGGEAPYTFLWSDGATSQNRQGLDPDTYTVTVTDARGCSKQENIFVRIPQHYFSENQIALEVFAFDLDTKPNFTYVCEIYLEEDYLSDEFTLIGQEEHSVDEEGKTVFEVNEYLDAYLEPVLPDTTQGLVRLDSQFKRFYLRFTEKFGVDPTLSTFSQQETFYVLLGGLSFEEYSTKDFFLHHLPQQRPFYTWQPVEKEVFPQQPEFLHYLINEDDLPEFRVWMKLFYPDGATSEEQLFQYLKPNTQSQENQYEIFRFPAGYDQLSVGGYSCQTCYQYELYVTDANDVQISETRRYIVNHEHYEEQNFFFFLNSLGCYDTLAATGKPRYQLGIEEETVERDLPYDYQPTDRRVEILKKTAEPEVLQPVGYPTKEMMLALQDFVLSKAYYKYEDDGTPRGRVIPITVSMRNAQILDENENLQELDFTYQLPRMQKFTPKLKRLFSNKITASANIEERNITLQVEGGQPGYVYQWTDAGGRPGSTDKDRTELPNGTYSVLITDQSSPRQAVSLCQLVIDAIVKPNLLTLFNEGSFEDITQQQVEDDISNQDLAHFSVELVDAPVQAGSKALKITKNAENTEVLTTEMIPIVRGNYRASAWVYFPSGVTYLFESDEVAVRTSNSTITPEIKAEATLADMAIRDQWQYIQIELLIFDNQEQGQQFVRFASLTDARDPLQGAGEYYFIDQLRIEAYPETNYPI